MLAAAPEIFPYFCWECRKVFRALVTDEHEVAIQIWQAPKITRVDSIYSQTRARRRKNCALNWLTISLDALVKLSSQIFQLFQFHCAVFCEFPVAVPCLSMHLIGQRRVRHAQRIEIARQRRCAFKQRREKPTNPMLRHGGFATTTTTTTTSPPPSCWAQAEWCG